MEVKIVENYQEMSRLAAILLAAEVIENPHTILGLATGSTPVGLYKELITMYQNGKLDFSDVKTFNLDEYVGLAAEHEQSYHYFMKKNLFEHINMKEENIHIPRGDAADISEEALRYEQEIQKTGKIQLQLLGLGENGHIGFNEPADSFSVQTGEIVLADSTIEANQRFFERREDVPKTAISIGIGTIINAEKILLVACGEKKAKAVKSVVEGRVTPHVPGSILQFHPHVTVIADRAATALLKK